MVLKTGCALKKGSVLAARSNAEVGRECNPIGLYALSFSIMKSLIYVWTIRQLYLHVVRIHPFGCPVYLSVFSPEL